MFQEKNKTYLSFNAHKKNIKTWFGPPLRFADIIEGYVSSEQKNKETEETGEKIEKIKSH